MLQPEAAATIKQWMEHFADASCTSRVIETSAGAGPGRDYAYLHFRTEDGEHSALVLRTIAVNGSPEIRAVLIDAGPDDIRDRVDEVTHGQAITQS
jgi:hypothetical protein